MRCLKVNLSLFVGEKSFWKPYFDVFPEPDLLAFWTDAELNELQDPELVKEALRYRIEIDDEWKEALNIFNKYPKIFPKDKINKDLFKFVYGNVVTRCFGWSMPCTMLIPVADILNHAPIDCGNEMFDTKLHTLVAKEEGKKSRDAILYRTKAKMALDFSDLTKTHTKTEGAKTLVKELKIEDDIVEICKDFKDFTLNKSPYNIWNMYHSLSKE